MTKQIAIFASGRGSNAKAIINYFSNQRAINVQLIICNRKAAGAFDIAKQENVKAIHISKDDFDNEAKVLEVLKSVDYIILAGFLLKIPNYLVEKFENKIINVHPALLPKYGGKGMYGMHVHEAVFNAKEQETGITIHLVDAIYDNGAHIAKFAINIEGVQSPEEIAQKIHQLEHQHFPRVIEDYILKQN
jgi:phosphoribosylglycinamide formyltransferase-1